MAGWQALQNFGLFAESAVESRVGDEALAVVGPPFQVSGILVPCRGHAQAVFPADLLRPAEFAELASVNVVAGVVEGSVLYVGDVVVWVVGKVKDLDEVVDGLQVGLLQGGANVVDSVDFGPVQNDVKGPCAVGGVDVVAGVRAVAVDEDFLAGGQQAAGLGDELIGELHGPVDVVSAGHDDGHAKGDGVGSANKLGGGLCAGVRVGGRQHGLFLLHGGLAAVHLVGGDVYEAGDLSVLACRLEEDVCADDVVCGEGNGGLEGVVHVC
mmetsp:Transcript_31709/g.77642  ORF Transcript_31709/g.77642 Transcript_31709/m.77642 type:complete len:268 (+) Transcript_31709:168-971(+)